MDYKIPKGVFDILPKEPSEELSWREVEKWQHVESILRQTSKDYCFEEIRTPIFEHTELFIRGVGDSSDIVSKEMYTFLDKGERSLTLRPEGTASVMRAFLDNQLYQMRKIHKFFYIGPMFRYERPQAGRYRQHHQFGAEAIGVASPYQDVEMIDLLCEIYRRLGLRDLTVMVNSVGDEKTRASYREALQNFLEPHLSSLSADSQVRFSKNVLRILDSKDQKDQEILKAAPSILHFLSEKAKEHFETVCALLTKENIRYEINQKLVRGLDYYNHTVFEVTCGELGAQNTIGAGGRFDGLIKQLGGPDIPAVGFASGLERILQTMSKQNCLFPKPGHPFLYLIALDEASMQFCFTLIKELREKHIPAQMDFSGKKLSQCFQNANEFSASYTLVIGEQELVSKTAKIKNMQTRSEEEIDLQNVRHILEQKWLTK